MSIERLAKWVNQSPEERHARVDIIGTDYGVEFVVEVTATYIFGDAMSRSRDYPMSTLVASATSIELDEAARLALDLLAEAWDAA